MPVWRSHGIASRVAEDLTPTEARVLDFIVAFHDQYGRFPSLRSIRVEFAYRSVGSARYHVDKLDKKGWLAIRRERFLTRIEWALRRTADTGSDSGYRGHIRLSNSTKPIEA